MNEQFNYDKVFMGVVLDKPKDYIRTGKEDYRLKCLTEAITIKRGRLLDIGCGGGILTESLTYYFPKMQIFGCDISKTAISYAKKLGSGKVKYEVIKDKRLPYADDILDVCLCLDVLEHIPDIQFFLKEVKRILKNNGQFFLIVPCERQPFTYTWLFQKLKIGDQLTSQNWGHIHPEFTHQGVINLLLEHGFIPTYKSYSEHLLWQLISIFIYFLPKEILKLVFGKKASRYSDSEIIKITEKKKKKTSFMLFIRQFWIKLNEVLRILAGWETEVFKNVPFTAWKINLLTRNIKHE